MILVAQLVKNPPAMQETRVQFLGWEYPLEKGKATHFSILAWRIPWVTNSWTWLSDFHFLFTFSYAEYTMWNARLDEAQAGFKIARKNINNLRNADDTTLMAESKEELTSLLMKVKKESEKADLKLNIQKTKIMTSGPIFHGK